MLAEVAVEVQVALVTTAGVVTAAGFASIPAVLARRSSRRIESAVGEANGEGTAIQMLERILDGQAGHDKRIANLELGHQQLTTSQARLEGRLEGRIDVLERAAIRPPST